MSKHPNARALAALLLLASSMAYLPSASAQFIKVEAGASDLLPSEGGTITFQGANYAGYLGAGDLGGSFGVGAYFKTDRKSVV